MRSGGGPVSRESFYTGWISDRVEGEKYIRALESLRLIGLNRCWKASATGVKGLAVALEKVAYRCSWVHLARDVDGNLLAKAYNPAPAFHRGYDRTKVKRRGATKWPVFLISPKVDGTALKRIQLPPRQLPRTARSVAGRAIDPGHQPPAPTGSEAKLENTSEYSQCTQSSQPILGKAPNV